MINKVMLVGRLGKDLEKFEGQTPFYKASMATDELIKGEKVGVWHDLVFFGQTGELASSFLKKGSKLYVEGKLSYKTKEDGEKKIKYTNIVVNKFVSLESKKESEQPTAKGQEENFFPF